MPSNKAKSAPSPRPSILELATKWQRLLGLQHWTIAVNVVPPEQLEIAGSNELRGLTIFDMPCRGATIWCADETAGHFVSLEFTLVHELTHVFLLDLGIALPTEREELLINCMARAFLCAHDQAEPFEITVTEMDHVPPYDVRCLTTALGLMQNAGTPDACLEVPAEALNSLLSTNASRKTTRLRR